MTVGELARYINSGFSFSDEQKDAALKKFAAIIDRINVHANAVAGTVDDVIALTE